MVAVEADNNEIRVNIPTEGMSPESVVALLGWLRAEVAARRSLLPDKGAWQLAEETKARWWAKTGNGTVCQLPP